MFQKCSLLDPPPKKKKQQKTKTKQNKKTTGAIPKVPDVTLKE